MTEICCFIKEQFFIDNAHYIKILDPGNTTKQSRRTHLCLKISSDENNFYIPLRNKLGADIRKYGRIGHAIPASGRPEAGLDYRYTLIVNNPKYIEIPSAQCIPNSQYRKLLNDYYIIQSEFDQYLKGFVKTAKRNRIAREALYRESSLVNFFKELGIQRKTAID